MIKRHQIFHNQIGVRAWSCPRVTQAEKPQCMMLELKFQGSDQETPNHSATVSAWRNCPRFTCRVITSGRQKNLPSTYCRTGVTVTILYRRRLTEFHSANH